jgi:solute carrier family 25 S-adenosylmethionine transporter 26
MVHASAEALASTGALASADVPSVLTVVKDIYRRNGVSGFYPTLTATLARNIPSAVIRFTMYEEIRSRMVLRQREKRTNSRSGLKGQVQGEDLTALEVAGFVLAGSAASAFASTCCTPLGMCHVCAQCVRMVLRPLSLPSAPPQLSNAPPRPPKTDVVKTRIATGMIPPGTSLPAAVCLIYAREGLNGLFAGVSSRIVGSTLFGGVGFASFEAFKILLGYDNDHFKQTTMQRKPRRKNLRVR